MLRTSRSYVVCRNSTSNTHTFPVFSWHMLSLLFVAIFSHIFQLDFSLFTQQHKKDIYFDGSVPSPLPRASFRATPASYGEKSRAKMMHKYFDLFTVACWDHSARLVLKTILKILQVQQSLCLLICFHTDTVSPLRPAFPSA